MKTVCIDCFSNLPVPATQGGAIQTRYTTLLEENEKHHRINLIIISPYDKEAMDISKQYKYGRVVYVRRNDNIKRIYNKIVAALNKLSLREYPICNYDEAVENYHIKRVKADYYVTVGNGAHYYPIVKKYGIDRVIFYIQTEVRATEVSDRLFRRCVGVSDYVIHTYYKYSQWDEREGRTVHNCTDELHLRSISLSERKAVRQKLELSDNDFVVLYTGRIVPDKGIEQLIQAVSCIQNSGVKLVICGGAQSGHVVSDGYQDKIRGLVEANRDRMRMTGYIPHDQLYQYYGMADVQVVPSLWEEAAGLVVIEGMYCGLPLIITDSGGMREYAGDCAIVVERGENLVTDIQKNIELLRNDAELRQKMSEEGIDRARLFTREKFYHDFVNCFESWD